MQAPPAAAMPTTSDVRVHVQDHHDDPYAKPRVDRTAPEIIDNATCARPIDFLLCFDTCFVLPERTSAVQLYFGHYSGTITKPGCYFRNSCLVDIRRISNAVTPIELPNLKVADANGNPLIVSGIVTYEIVDSRRAAIDIPNAHSYVLTQAPAVLKRVISQYPYDSDLPDVPCLRKEPQVVSSLMKDSLQERVRVAGVRIESFSINELSYAPEIAQSMLRRQQAEALINARQRIVEGASQIAKSACQDPALTEIMTPQDRSRLLSNMLVVLVSDKDATPVIELGTNHGSL